MYRLMQIIEPIFASLTLCKRRHRYGLAAWQSVVLTFMAFAGGFLGAKILHITLYWEKFSENGVSAEGGFSFYGAILFCAITMMVAGKLFHLTPIQSLDACAAGSAATIGIQRIGCFFADCCGGWEVCVGNICFHWPTQMIESIGGFAIYAFLLQIESENKFKGLYYPIFLASYGTLRFCVEILRATPKNILFLSIYQWFSLISLIVGTVWIFRQRKKCD